MSDRAAWLAGLDVGAWVILRSPLSGAVRLHQVSEATPEQVFTAGRWWSRATGEPAGIELALRLEPVEVDR